MPATIFRRVVLALGLWAVVSLPSPAARQEAPEGAAQPPTVFSAEVESIIHPVSAEFMMATMERAETEGAALVVFTLRTPGGLVDSTRDIITRMIRSTVPIVVFVGPSGARAASAGFLITIAADVAVMAPGTSIGAAHPVSGDGQQTSETVAQKAASDVAAYARSIAGKRGRNVELSELAVTESRAFTEEEARRAEPPLVDLIASSVEDLLAELDGREITRFDGEKVTLRTSGAEIVPVAMTTRQRLLSAIAHPQVAYLLFSLGTLGLTIELWNPGAVLPGVVGGICLLLAFFAFQILPVNYVGLLLIAFGIVLLVLEVKVASFGLLAAGGIAGLLLGSMLLIDSPLPELQIGFQLILPVVFAVAVIVLGLVRLAVTALRRPATTGSAGMLQERGRALGDFGAGVEGRVAAHGEIWTAVTDEPIREGDPVEVVAVDGLTLRVRPTPPPTGGKRS